MGVLKDQRVNGQTGEKRGEKTGEEERQIGRVEAKSTNRADGFSR